MHVICCDAFSSSSVVSHAFSAPCMYSKFEHHQHPLGYLSAKFCFLYGLHCWASPCRRITYSLTQSIIQLIWCPGNRSYCFVKPEQADNYSNWQSTSLHGCRILFTNKKHAALTDAGSISSFAAYHELRNIVKEPRKYTERSSNAKVTSDVTSVHCLVVWQQLYVCCSQLNCSRCRLTGSMNYARCFQRQ